MTHKLIPVVKHGIIIPDERACLCTWLRFAIVKMAIVSAVNTLRPRQNCRHFADDIFNSIFLNENVWMPITISLKFVPKDPINNISALVQIMAWRRPGDKPLSEPMMVTLLTHICVTRPQWVTCKWFGCDLFAHIHPVVCASEASLKGICKWVNT